MNKLIVATLTAALVITAGARAQAKQIAEDGVKSSLPAVQNQAKKPKKTPYLMPHSANTLQEGGIRLRTQSPQPNGLIAPMY